MPSPIEPNVADRRFPDSVMGYRQAKGLRRFSSEPDVSQLQEGEACLFENSGTLYLGVRWQGVIKRLQFT